MRDLDYIKSASSLFELPPSNVHNRKLDYLIALTTLIASIGAATVLGLQMVGAI